MKLQLLSYSLLAGLTALSTLSAEPEKAATKPVPASAKISDIRIVMETSKGNIEATIFASKTPMTAANFLNLAKRGYYDGLTFHRVLPDFMIQGGDPKGTGSGGPGYKFKDETRQDLKHSKGGIFSMANSDRVKNAWSNTGNTNGSQFFVTHKATPWLDGKHTVFGEVTKGKAEVVDKIAMGDKIIKIKVLDSTDALFAKEADNLAKWNKVLDAKK
jgi:peptidyl-prolyl cis-trans isomerase B (cyclophilin B)